MACSKQLNLVLGYLSSDPSNIFSFSFYAFHLGDLCTL